MGVSPMSPWAYPDSPSKGLFIAPEDTETAEKIINSQSSIVIGKFIALDQHL